MKITIRTKTLKQVARSACVALLCAALTWPGMVVWAQDTTAASGQQASTPIPPEQLESLVAPIALYPDSLVAQILAATTFPAEVVEADRWVQAHPDLKGDDLAKAVDCDLP